MPELKVVVTGGAGFIGSHIAEYWAGNNTEVHVIDNLRSGNLQNIRSIKNLIFHNVSVTDREAVFEILEGATYVHHLAAMVSVPESIMKPLECIDINVKGLLNVLDAAVKHKVRKVVLSSSAAVYGDNPESPKTTEMVPMPKTPYATTKLDGENHMRTYNEKFGLGTISLRYFNVFGPRQNPASQYAAAVPIFIKEAIEGTPITIYGDGEQTRDFIFVKDVVNANILAVSKPEAAGVYNIALGQGTSINEIARMIIDETGSGSQIVYKEERPGDIRHSIASIEKTKRLLGFVPRYSLLEGLRDTIRFFREQSVG